MIVDQQDNKNPGHKKVLLDNLMHHFVEIITRRLFVQFFLNFFQKCY